MFGVLDTFDGNAPTVLLRACVRREGAIHGGRGSEWIVGKPENAYPNATLFSKTYF